MKKKLLKAALLVAVVAVAGLGAHKAQAKKPVLSDIMLANVEALTDEEGGMGAYDKIEQVTDHFYNGNLYKQSKITECYPGGKNKCTRSAYYRTKQEDGSWSKWIPA